jgi:hypothetical protein
VRLVGRGAVFAPGDAGALPWEDELEKKDCGETSVRMGSGARNRASLRAFIFSARWTSTRIAGSNTEVRGAEMEKSADNPITFVCWENYSNDALDRNSCALTQVVLV